jgi:phage terminase Nu1 subunit (DNA packaging protein)
MKPLRKSKDGYYAHGELAKHLKCPRQKIHNAVIAGLEEREDGKVSLVKAEAWFKQRHLDKSTSTELRAEKMRAEIAKHRAVQEKAELELAQMRGELHPVKDCAASLGQLLTTVWMEIQAFPHRIQTAFPHVPNLEKTAVDIVNTSARRLQDYGKRNAGKEIK